MHFVAMFRDVMDFGWVVFFGYDGSNGQKPSELLDLLFEKVGPHYYDRIDSRFDAAQNQKF